MPETALRNFGFCCDAVRIGRKDIELHTDHIIRIGHWHVMWAL